VRRTLCAISLALLCSTLVPAASTSRPAGGGPRRVARPATASGFQPSLALRLWKSWTGGFRTMDNPPPLPTPTPVPDLHTPIPD